jgi:hypothetical protein
MNFNLVRLKIMEKIATCD